MTCPQCAFANPPAMAFCGRCGTRLASLCPSCGFANPEGFAFCGKCGARVTGASAPPVQNSQTFASPQSYTPKHLAEKILTSRAALEGERKQVTVLFADLKGSMELLADGDPEDARKLLDPVLELMMEAVHRYEGTVNQVMGDGIMALFGAPLAHEDHAVRACYAALRMQDAVRRYSDELRRAQGVEVQIRVGLNSGEVVVRSIGSDLRMDYTAVGQTTHLAARMEQLAPPGTIRLTGETVRLAEGYVEVRSLGPIPVKGLPNPIELFELTGAGTARTRLQAAVLRGLTNFVGRDAEVEHLRRVLGQAGDGHGQVVAIVGEAGVGKSRLVYEFTHSHRVQNWLILEASSVSYGKATSSLPVIDLLKGYFKIGDRDDHQEMRAKVLGRVLALDRALEPLLPPLLALLDVPVADPAWQNLDPPQRRRLTLDAVKRLLLRESQRQPFLVVFEDLHWVDGETQALLDSLVESLGSARMLLLVNYRPDYEHRWGSKTAYSQLRLDTLPTESTAELLAALLGPDPGLGPLTQMLVKRGNPFFLEETVRTLVETGALAGERGAYRLTRPVEALQVPATVQVILAARIDRLPAEEKQLLQAASVIGKVVPYALLAAIAEQPEEILQRGLARLQEAEFLYETQLFPDREFTFKHALTHDVAYAGLLGERRRALHAAVAAAIERLHADRLVEHVERLVSCPSGSRHKFGGMIIGRPLGKAGDAREDLVGGLGPDEGGRGGVVRVDEGADRRLQLREAAMHAAANLLVRQLREPALHEVQPGPVRRREMHVEARALGQPPLDERRLVGPVVIQDEMNREGRGDRGINRIEELPELEGPVATVHLPEDFAGLDIERRKQRGRAVAAVVVGPPLDLAGAHGQQRLRPIERLDLRLLVDAQDDGVFGRVHVQADDVAHFLDQQRIGRELEGLAAVGLQAERVPDAGDCHAAEPGGLGHPAHAPVRLPAGRRLQRPGHDAFDGVVRDRPRGSGPRLVVEPLQPVANKAAAPLADRLIAHAQLARHDGARQAVGAQQDQARPQR